MTNVNIPFHPNNNNALDMHQSSDEDEQNSIIHPFNYLLTPVERVTPLSQSAEEASGSDMDGQFTNEQIDGLIVDNIRQHDMMLARTVPSPADLAFDGAIYTRKLFMVFSILVLFVAIYMYPTRNNTQLSIENKQPSDKTMTVDLNNPDQSMKGNISFFYRNNTIVILYYNINDKNVDVYMNTTIQNNRYNTTNGPIITSVTQSKSNMQVPPEGILAKEASDNSIYNREFSDLPESLNGNEEDDVQNNTQMVLVYVQRGETILVPDIIKMLIRLIRYILDFPRKIKRNVTASINDTTTRIIKRVIRLTGDILF